MLIALTTPAALAISAEVPLTLAQDGKPAATLVIAQQPTRAAQFADGSGGVHLLVHDIV